MNETFVEDWASNNEHVYRQENQFNTANKIVLFSFVLAPLR